MCYLHNLPCPPVYAGCRWEPPAKFPLLEPSFACADVNYYRSMYGPISKTGGTACASPSPPPHRSLFPQLHPRLIIKIITSDFLHGSFSLARSWKARAPLSDFPHWALISTQGPKVGRGAKSHHLPHTHQRGTDLFSRGVWYGGVISVRLSIRCGVAVVGNQKKRHIGDMAERLIRGQWRRFFRILGEIQHQQNNNS